MQPDNYKRRRKIILYTLVFFLVIIPIAISIFILLTRQPEPAEEIEDHPEHDIPVMLFENSWQLNNFIGLETPFDRLESALSDGILKESEIESAPLPNDTDGIPSNGYLVTFVESSVEYFPDQLPITLSFNLTVSDGRTYTVYVYVNGRDIEQFLVAIIQRTDKANENNSAYVYYTDEDQLPNINTWLEQIGIKSAVVLKERLEE